jgi:hypothetical protein
MLKIKKIGIFAVMTFAVSLVTGLSVTDSFGQKSGKERYRKVSLKKDARKNGYATTTSYGVIYFEAKEVEDPLEKKLLEGLKLLEYRCRQDDLPTTLSLTFSAGNSRRARVPCLILIKPTILIGDPD